MCPLILYMCPLVLHICTRWPYTYVFIDLTSMFPLALNARVLWSYTYVSIAHCKMIWIYLVFTINQMCCKCIYMSCQHCRKYKTFLYYSGNVTYAIFTYTFAPHVINSKYMVNPNYHPMLIGSIHRVLLTLQVCVHWSYTYVQMCRANVHILQGTMDTYP